jgi:tRNA pseudouridine38-40 synthase
MILEYDGAAFHGWQIQENAHTVQEAVEDGLATVLGDTITVHGSSRTDAGVHARGQVAHFSHPDRIDTYGLKGSVNGVLPATIAVPRIEEVRGDFHARFHARQRRYRYYVSTQPVAIDRHVRHFIYPPVPDFEVMNQAARTLRGEQSFASFSLTPPQTDHYICAVKHAVWSRGDHPNHWCFTIEANRFLHGMVRAIVGTLLEIGQEKRSADEIPEILAREDRSAAGASVPAHALVLESVEY